MKNNKQQNNQSLKGGLHVLPHHPEILIFFGWLGFLFDHHFNVSMFLVPLTIENYARETFHRP